MIKHRLTLKKSLENRPVYIWDVGVRSLEAFTRLASRLVDIKGFVTESEEYVGLFFMNRKIIHPEEIEENALIIVNDRTTSSSFKRACQFGKALRLTDAMDLNESLRGARCTLMGTNDSCWNLIKKLDEKNVRVKRFIEIFEENPPSSIMGLKVTGIRKSGLSRRDSVITAAMMEEHEAFFINALLNAGFEGDIYVDEFFMKTHRWGVDPVLMIDTALKKNKRIILVSDYDMDSELVRKMLSLYGVNIDREVTSGNDGDRGLEDIWALADEDPNESVVLICVQDQNARADIMDALTDLGFTDSERNFAGVQSAYLNREFLLGKYYYLKDEGIGYSLDYTERGGIPGWMIYGDPDTAEKRIMILGGSTSAETFYGEGWVSKFYRKLRTEGINAAVYNGAHVSNTALNERDRLVRGIEVLKPDIVISMSGVNNKEKSSNIFDMDKDLSLYQIWKKAEVQMKMICTLSGADFYPFLQPINMEMEEYSLSEVFQFSLESRFGKSVLYDEGIKDEDVICLIDMFFHEDDMFIDSCHYSEKARTILSDTVYEHVKESL